MPYHFTAEPGLLGVVLFGAVTGAELQSLAAELEKIERALPVTPNRLTDLSQLSGRELSTLAVEKSIVITALIAEDTSVTSYKNKPCLTVSRL